MNRRHFLKLVGITLTPLVPGILTAAQLPDPDRMAPKITPPDPIRPPDLPDPSLGLRVDLGSAVDLPSPGVARGMAERAISGLDSLTEGVRKDVESLAKFQKRLAELTGEIAGLKQAKAQALDELRRGLWCSKCGRSKSQIEREAREDFYAHLRRVNGQIVQAPQEKIEATAREYEQQIAAKEREEAAIPKAREERLKAILAAESKIQEGIDLWRLTRGLEQELLVAHANTLEQKTTQEIRHAEQQLAKIDAERQRLHQQRALDTATDESLLAHRKFWENTRHKIAAGGLVSLWYCCTGSSDVPQHPLGARDALDLGSRHLPGRVSRRGPSYRHRKLRSDQSSRNPPPSHAYPVAFH
ncbi:MAG: hypothetical protein HYZ81_21395 [Nitrospinae bacterium]|nr:hypothetical protein [Nitrospinota bacterium]